MLTSLSSATHNPGMKSRFRLFLIMLLSSVSLFWLLYLFRSYDDSRLASWADVYQTTGPLKTLLVIILMQAAAFLVSSYSMPERLQPYFLAAFSFAASVLFWAEPEMIVDASRYFIYAKYLKVYGIMHFLREWGGSIGIWTDLPAVPLIYGLSFELFGESRAVIQVLNSGFFAGSVLLTYAIGRELFDKDIGFNAALLFMGIPYIYTQVPLMLVDIASLFFLMLGIYLFLAALRRGGLFVFYAALAVAAAFFTKYSTWLMLTVLPVIYAAELYRLRRSGMDRTALRGMIAFFLSFFLISLVIALKHDEMMRQIHLLVSYQRPGLSRWGESLISTYLFQVHPALPVMALVSVYAAFRGRDASYIAVAWLVLLVLVLQVRRIRYIVMVFPMLALMASCGMAQLRQRFDTRFISMSVAAFSLAVALSGFLPFMQNTSAVNFINAGKYLDSLDVNELKVFTPLPDEYHLNPAVSVPLLDLFTDKKIVYDYAPGSYPPPADISSSRLRFTWEYRNPPFYQDDAGGSRAVVVISDRKDSGELPEIRKEIEGLSGRMDFSVRDDMFSHQTLITVYH